MNGLGGAGGPGAGAAGGGGGGGAGVTGIPAPAGYTAELSYIHAMVEALSQQLAENKRVLDDVVTGVGRVRNRAHVQQLGNEELIGGASEELQNQESNMDATISALAEALDAAKHAKEENAHLLAQYVSVLASMLKQFHEYKQKHVADVAAWHRSYRHQLAEARAENSRLRDQIWQMQERAGRANAALRSFRAAYDADPARWDRHVTGKALRQELRFWKRMAMPSVPDDDLAYWSDDDDLIDPAEKARLLDLEQKAAEEQRQLQQQQLQQQQQQQQRQLQQQKYQQQQQQQQQLQKQQQYQQQQQLQYRQQQQQQYEQQVLFAGGSLVAPPLLGLGGDMGDGFGGGRGTADRAAGGLGSEDAGAAGDTLDLEGLTLTSEAGGGAEGNARETVGSETRGDDEEDDEDEDEDDEDEDDDEDEEEEDDGSDANEHGGGLGLDEDLRLGAAARAGLPLPAVPQAPSSAPPPASISRMSGGGGGIPSLLEDAAATASDAGAAEPPETDGPPRPLSPASSTSSTDSAGSTGSTRGF